MSQLTSSLFVSSTYEYTLRGPPTDSLGCLSSFFFPNGSQIQFLVLNNVKLPTFLSNFSAVYLFALLGITKASKTKMPQRTRFTPVLLSSMKDLDPEFVATLVDINPNFYLPTCPIWSRALPASVGCSRHQSLKPIVT